MERDHYIMVNGWQPGTQGRALLDKAASGSHRAGAVTVGRTVFRLRT